VDDRLRSEDRNKTGSISRQSLLAALTSLGFSAGKFFNSSDAHRSILDNLEGRDQVRTPNGKGPANAQQEKAKRKDLLIDDFLALVFYTN
jgi:hypothetical protein